MTIEVAGLAWAEKVVGVPFPRGDEDALWRCALAWRTAAGRLRAVPAQAAEAGAAVAGLLDGATADRFALLWQPLAAPDGPFPRLADACDAIAAGFDHAASQVEHAKLAFLAALAILATAMNALWLTLAGSVGPGWLGIPAAIARIELALRDVVTRLVLAVAIGADGLHAAVVTLTFEVRRDLAGLLRHGSIDGPPPGELPAGGNGLPADISGGAFDTVPAALPVGLPDGLAELLLASLPVTPGAGTSPPTPPPTVPSTVDTPAQPAVLPPVWVAPVVPTAPAPTPAPAAAPVPAPAPRPPASGPAPAVPQPPPSGPAPASVVPKPTAPEPAPVPAPSLPKPATPAVPAPPPVPAPGPGDPGHPGVLGDQLTPTSPRPTQAGTSVFAVLPGTTAVERTTPSMAGPGRTGISSGSSDVDGEPLTLGDDEALARARACMYATGAGYGFHPPGDENRDLARAVPPLPGYVTLDLPGDARGVTLDNGRSTSDQWAQVLRTLVATGELTLRPGEGIRLMTGAATEVAQAMADVLGVAVLAPDRLLWTDLAGEVIVASVDASFGPVDPPDGSWVCYETRTARYTEVM